MCAEWRREGFLWALRKIDGSGKHLNPRAILYWHTHTHTYTLKNSEVKLLVDMQIFTYSFQPVNSGADFIFPMQITETQQPAICLQGRKYSGLFVSFN